MEEHILKRVFLIVLDSFGIGEMPDASDYFDEGSNTIKSCASSKYFELKNMRRMGLFNIDGVDCKEKVSEPIGAFARLAEASRGKDTTTGHWEMAGLISKEPFPVFPNGFPDNLINDIERLTGRKVICNLPYSGTEVIKDYGRRHIDTGGLIIYTSADSVLQIAVHEDIVPLAELYSYCEKIRELCVDEYGVGRVIARPFTGRYPDFTRTSGRHDYSLKPYGKTMLDYINECGKSVISIGKINDIFAGQGITESVRTSGNAEGIDRTIEYIEKDFDGIVFTNLVDFDMLYGHRNDIDGYAKALSFFDKRLEDIVGRLKDDDILFITADHGCDPGTVSTDHSREYVPLIIFGKCIKAGVNLGTRDTFSDIASSILEFFGIESNLPGSSFMTEIIK